MLRVVVPDIQGGTDTFYKKLIALVPLKNVTSRFAMEKIKATTRFDFVRSYGSALDLVVQPRRCRSGRPGQRAGHHVADRRRVVVVYLAQINCEFGTLRAVGSATVY
jgi:hypothetical protein